MSATAADGALRVDRVLENPLAVPQGLDLALRRMERDARERRSRLAPLAARGGAAAPVRGAAEELERFLDDELRSPLLRALRRPLWQIAPGTSGWRTLERCWKGIQARSEAAVELQAALDGIRAAVARVRERFADELPRATRALLDEARLGEEQLARLRRAKDADALHQRLRRAEHELERLWTRVDAGEAARLQRGEGWAEEVSPGELLALLQLRLRERGRLRHERDRARSLRLMAGRQVQAIGQVRTRPARDPAHAVAERLGNLLLRDEAGAHGGEDLPLWGELLGSACDALHEPGRSGGWTAQLDPPGLPGERGFGSTQFVIPIDDVYALVTPHLQSSVRVSSRAVDLDRAVECVAFLEHGDAEMLPLAGLDVAPLFEGLQAEPAWYATARRAQLRVIARTGEGWIARLVRRGALRRTAGCAWDPERADEGRLRVLGTLAAPAPAEPWEVGEAPGGERVFCGLWTLAVTPPLAECALAWLRVPAGGGWAEDAARAEEEWMRAVARAVPLTVPAWAGRGRLSARGVQGPLYVPPLGLRTEELPPLETWLRSSAARPLLEAVARLWLRVNRAGYGMGVYHADALVFSLGWPRRREDGPAVHSSVAEAPFAARLGHYHRRPPQDEAVFPRWTGLGCRVLPPAVIQGEVALPATEAQAFALFALDTLALKPLPLAGVVPGEALAEMVPDLAAFFTYPDLAARLARVLRPGAETSHMVEWIQALAEPRSG